MIGDLVRWLGVNSDEVLGNFGEDAAVIRRNDESLLLATDGIWSLLMEADPYWAGYCAVLVNIHDIAAMGGTPLAMVDVLSVSNREICKEVVRGMSTASGQFGVPIVGGHLHPDTKYNVIDVAIMGVVRTDDIIYSHTAQVGDKIIVAIDLEGRVHPSVSLNWDSVTMKSPQTLRDQIGVMQELGREHIVTAGKDISNPGAIGTLGMLLEVSRKGAFVDLGALPRPDLKKYGIRFEQWVKMYPGMGFVVTSREENADEVCRRFGDKGICAKIVGTVTDTHKLTVTYHDETTEVFDLEHNGVMGLCR
ncbi:MAG: methanogenesis marker 2 protein [Methanoculleaceae archaeon]